MLHNRMLMASNIEPAEAVFVDQGIAASDLTTYTFTSKSLGSIRAGKKNAIVVTSKAAAASNQTVSTMTAGGISATNITRQGGGTVRIELWEVDTPTTSSGDIVVTWDVGCEACGIQVYALYNSGPVFNFNAANVDNLTLNIPANGTAVAGIQSTATSTFSWTNLTEDNDEVVESANLSQSSASDDFTTAQTSLAITATPSSSNNPRIIAASWGPV